MDELARSFDPAILGDWVQKIPQKYRIMVIDRAREDLAFRRNCVDAKENRAMQRMLVEEAKHWAMGVILRAILEEERAYWSRVNRGNRRQRAPGNE